MRRRGVKGVWLVNTLYLTDFSASTFVQKYTLLTLPIRGRKQIYFNGLSGVSASADPGRSYFPVFSRRKFGPVRAAVNHPVLTDNPRVKHSFTIMAGRGA